MTKFIGEFDLSMLPNIDEFDKRYAGAYLKVRLKNGVEDVFMYDGYNGTRCIFVNDTYGNIELNLETEVQISPVFPKVGLFNMPNLKSALFTCKVPVRQNRRSMSNKNVKYEDPVLTAYRSSRREVAFSFPIIRESINPTYPKNIEQAVQLLKKENKISVAFSPDYMVSKGIKEDQPVLWHKAVPIGVFDSSTVRVDAHYAQEVKDYVRDNSEQFSVQELY